LFFRVVFVVTKTFLDYLIYMDAVWLPFVDQPILKRFRVNLNLLNLLKLWLLVKLDVFGSKLYSAVKQIGVLRDIIPAL